MADQSTDQLPIGQRIMRYRVRAGMSRAQLSGLIGKSPSWLYKVERGVLTPDRLSVLSDLAQVLRVDISELAGAPVPAALVSSAGTGLRPAPVRVVPEDAAPPTSPEPGPEPPAAPRPATTAGERRRAGAAVLAAAVALAACMIFSSAPTPTGHGDSPHAHVAPPMTGSPGPLADTSAPSSTSATSATPGSPAGSNSAAALPPGTGPQSAPPPGSATAPPPAARPGAPQSQGPGARTSTAAPAPQATASPSPPAWNLAAWYPGTGAAPDQAGEQRGGCSNVAYYGDTGAVPDTGSWRVTVGVGSGGTLCVHWDNPGIDGTLTGPDGRSRLVHGGTWMVLSGGPGRYTLQLRRVDPNRPNHANLQIFG